MAENMDMSDDGVGKDEEEEKMEDETGEKVEKKKKEKMKDEDEEEEEEEEEDDNEVKQNEKEQEILPPAPPQAPAPPPKRNQHHIWVEKYRPSTLEGVLSQEHIIRTITKLVENDKLPHLLFYGKPGTGKTSTILAVARKIFGPRYPNCIMELNASDDRGIGVVREQIKVFASTRKLFHKGYKLVVLDEADHMTKEAQNALRRIIEKYTRNTRFCLICNYVNNIIPALRSRCTQFRFAPLRNDLIIRRIQEIAQLEGVKMDEGGLKSVVTLGNGDMRRCLHILQSCHLSFGVVNEKNVYLQVGQPSRKLMHQIVQNLFKDGFSEVYNLVSQMKEENGLCVQDIINSLYTYSCSLKPLKEEQKMFLLEKLGDIEHQSSTMSSEKLTLSAIVGIFQIARYSLVKNVSIESIWDNQFDS